MLPTPLSILISVLLFGFLYCCYHVYKWYKENQNDNIPITDHSAITETIAVPTVITATISHDIDIDRGIESVSGNVTDKNQNDDLIV